MQLNLKKKFGGLVAQIVECIEYITIYRQIELESTKSEPALELKPSIVDDYIESSAFVPRSEVDINIV